MTHYPTPATSPDPETVGGVNHLSGRISGFRSGILTGSVASSDPAPPTKLLVAADARTIGEATIAWDDSSPSEGGSGQRLGTWTFDARDLPPELLLEDAVTFTIRSTTQPSSLHSMEVDPSQFLSIAELSPGNTRLSGYVDGTENGIVRGWVWDPTDPTQRIKIALFLSESFCGTYIADQWRADLEATGRGDGRYGFSIPAQPFFERHAGAPAEAQVVTIVPELGKIPLAPHLHGRPRRFAIPRLSDAVHTTRELVTILASSEAFPKKVRVIDRTVRRMPDAFAADYVLLAIEFLRVEMLKVVPRQSTTWREYILAWWRERIIRRQIRRLSALATAIAASQTLLGTASNTAASHPKQK